MIRVEALWLSARWADAILDASTPAASSHWAEVARRYGCGGARQEAASGFPAVLEIGLPADRSALHACGDPERAAIQSFFALIAHVGDTNLLWSGGEDGLLCAQCLAIDFLAEDGVLVEGWATRAQDIHRRFVAPRLSQGGSADLLGVTLFLDAL